MYGIVTPAHYRKSVTITPSDTVKLTPRPRALLCLTTGNLYYVLDGDADATVRVASSVAANTILPLRVKLVMATTTTGTWAGLY